MTHYRFEFGINWDADNPQLQTGFVELDGSGDPTALASPYSLDKQDMLHFAVVDTTDSSPTMEVKEIVVWFRSSQMTGDLSPLNVDSFVIPGTKIASAVSYGSLYFTASQTHNIYKSESSELKEITETTTTAPPVRPGSRSIEQNGPTLPANLLFWEVG
ncbi:MAG TPA: hypothetical protein VKU40_03415 [Thermoanaerobaculia bacterium]|nr:hypothetical protein [Thermoanaerobaculia bacterium]